MSTPADDTPRDPLAEVLAVVIGGWFTDGDETWRLVPMTADGGLAVNSPASWFAEVIAARLRDAGATLDATRPSGDEALRSLLREAIEELHQYGLVTDHHDPSDKSGRWNVNGIETCAYRLCVESLAALRDSRS